MVTAILVAFEYIRVVNSTLIGAVFDLYHAYKWCSSFGANIYIFTDVDFNKHIPYLKLSAQHNRVDNDAATFLNNHPNTYIVKTKKDLFDNLKHVEYDSRVILYYSGHGIKESMMMPNQELVPFVLFRNSILNNLSPATEIFGILDCCNPSGLHLPFKLRDNNFRLSGRKVDCIHQPFLLITSSDDSEKSIATKDGSAFSRVLFSTLTLLNESFSVEQQQTIPVSRNRNLRRLMSNIASTIRRQHIGYSQTVSIFTSYYTDPVLWPWIGSKNSSDIVVDSSLSVLVIRNHNKQAQQDDQEK